MKIELYMASIDQDFSSQTLKRLLANIGSGKEMPSITSEPEHQKILNWNNWNNWDNWNNWNNWNNWSNFALAQRLSCLQPSQNLENIRIREESFGGLVYNSESRRVFKLDKEAYQTLRSLINGNPIEQVACQTGVDKNKIEKLVSYIYEVEE